MTILTQRLEDFSPSKFPIKEDRVVLCVKEPTHPDQNHLHGAWATGKESRDSKRLVCKLFSYVPFFKGHATSPVLRSAIWSFWLSIRKPGMCFANSTTYWTASVSRMAQCCHISSTDWEKREKSEILLQHKFTAESQQFNKLFFLLVEHIKSPQFS